MRYGAELVRDLMSIGPEAESFEKRQAELRDLVKKNPGALVERMEEVSSSYEMLAETDPVKRFQKMLDAVGMIRLPPEGVCPIDTDIPNQYCGRKLLPGFTECYWHSVTETKYDGAVIVGYFGESVTVAKAMEIEIKAGRSLSKAYLPNLALEGGVGLGPKRVHAADLTGAHFTNAFLPKVHFGYSRLDHANFAGANLEEAYLSDCSLTYVNFNNAKLHRTKLRNNRFLGSVGLNKTSFQGYRWGWFPTHSMLETYPEQCEPVYRDLSSYFASQGLFDDASWATYRACVMRQRMLRKQLSYGNTILRYSMLNLANYRSPTSGATDYDWKRMRGLWIMNLLLYAKTYLFMAVTGYGEKPIRVIITAFGVISCYTLVYFLGAGLIESGGGLTNSSFTDCLYFSLVTFSTLGYGDILPKHSFRLLAASEALMGILLCGLLLFCLGRRSVGRA